MKSKQLSTFSFQCYKLKQCITIELNISSPYSDQNKLIELEDIAKAAKKGKWASDVNVCIVLPLEVNYPKAFHVRDDLNISQSNAECCLIPVQSWSFTFK